MRKINTLLDNAERTNIGHRAIPDCNAILRRNLSERAGGLQPFTGSTKNSLGSLRNLGFFCQQTAPGEEVKRGFHPFREEVGLLFKQPIHFKRSGVYITFRADGSNKYAYETHK